VVLPRGWRREVSYCGHVLADRDSESSPGCPWDLSPLRSPQGLGRFAVVFLWFYVDLLLCLPRRLPCDLPVHSPSLSFLDLKQAPRGGLPPPRVPAKVCSGPCSPSPLFPPAAPKLCAQTRAPCPLLYSSQGPVSAAALSSLGLTGMWWDQSLCKQLSDGLARPKLTRFCLSLQGGHMLTPLPAATPMKPGSAVSSSAPLSRGREGSPGLQQQLARSLPWPGGDQPASVAWDGVGRWPPPKVPGLALSATASPKLPLLCCPLPLVHGVLMRGLTSVSPCSLVPMADVPLLRCGPCHLE